MCKYKRLMITKGKELMPDLREISFTYKGPKVDPLYHIDPDTTRSSSGSNPVLQSPTTTAPSGPSFE